MAATVTDTVDKSRKGPTNITYGEWQLQIGSDYNFGADYPYVNINRTIYRDVNPKSGYFYYLPAKYSLNWNPERGYAFYVNYLSADENGRGSVVITAELKPNISRKDLEIAKELLLESLKKEPDQVFVDLISMPLAETPKVAFKQQFGEKLNEIQVNVSSDFLQPITVSWKMDRVDDLFAALFNNIGLNGELVITPGGENMPASITIPMTLKLDSHETFGVFEMDAGWRTKPWANASPYPVKLKNLHVLRLDKSTGRPFIYTWDMASKEIPEKAQAKFDASLVPTWVDSDPLTKKMWLEYAVVPCNSCNATVKDQIVRGTSSRRMNNLEFTILTPLASTGTQLMKIKVRSFQADPNGLSKVNLPTLTITQDGAVLSGGQLFIPDGAKPDFEYFIELYKEDGTKYESEIWQKSSNLDVVIGKTQIQQLIPAFKSIK